MRIFLSYASEDEDVAKRILFSLRARGHTVFFDSASIRAGSDYEKTIEREVRRSHVFVFLVSSFSLSEGRFTRTELKFAEDKWPVAADHVLPVIIDETTIEELPPYLRSVSVLKPVGDVAAETAVAVQGLSKGRGVLSKSLRIAAIGAAAAALLAGAVFVATLQPVLAVSVDDPVRLGHGFFTDDARHMVSVTVENSGRLTAEQVTAHLEVRDGADGSIEQLSPSEALRTSVPQALVPDGRMSTRFDVLESAVDGKEWRACASRAGDSTICTEFASWETPALILAYGRLDAPLREQVVDFAVSEDAVFLLLSTRDLVRMTDDGSSREKLTGTPVALSATDDELYVATSVPNRIERRDPETLESIATSTLGFPANSFGEPVSTTPDVLVQQGGGVWIITRGNESENGLAWQSFNATSSQSSVPTFYEDLAFDLPGIDPHAFDFGLVSGSNDTTPATLWVWNRSNLWTFGGHDFEVISCAHNVTAEGPNIYAPDCDGNLVRLQLTGVGEDRGIQRVGDLGPIEGYGSGGETWPEFDFHVLESGAVVTAVALTRRGAWGGKSFSTVIGVNSEKYVVGIDQIRDARVLKIQSRGNRVWFLLESADGSARELVWLDLEA